MKHRLAQVTVISVLSCATIPSAIAESYPLPKVIAQSPTELPPNSLPPALVTPKIEITPIQLEIVSEGREPKQRFRFQVPSDRRETGTLVMNMESANTLAGNPTVPIKLPTNVVEMEIKVTKVDPNGDMHINFRYPSVQVVVTDDETSPEIVKLMRTLMPKLAQIQGEFIMDEKGQTKATKLASLPGSDPVSQQLSEQLTNSFSQLSSPIPELPIGQGAKWRTTNFVKANGISVKQIADYHLTDIRDGVAAIEIKLEQSGEPQTIQLPGLPAELAVKLKSFKTEGRGRMKIAFDRLLPLSSTAKLTSTGEMSVKIPGSNKELTTKIATAIDMSLHSESSTKK